MKTWINIDARKWKGRVEKAEIFCGFRDNISEKLHFDTSSRDSTDCDIEEDDWVFRVWWSQVPPYTPSSWRHWSTELSCSHCFAFSASLSLSLSECAFWRGFRGFVGARVPRWLVRLETKLVLIVDKTILVG